MVLLKRAKIVILEKASTPLVAILLLVNSLQALCVIQQAASVAPLNAHLRRLRKCAALQKTVNATLPKRAQGTLLRVRQMLLPLMVSRIDRIVVLSHILL